MAGDKLKHSLATLIDDFTKEESDAPFIFEIESRNRTKDILIIVRLTQRHKTVAFSKSAFIVKTTQHLEIFKLYLQFLSSDTFQKKLRK